MWYYFFAYENILCPVCHLSSAVLVVVKMMTNDVVLRLGIGDRPTLVRRSGTTIRSSMVGGGVGGTFGILSLRHLRLDKRHLLL